MFIKQVYLYLFYASLLYQKLRINLLQCLLINIIIIILTVKFSFYNFMNLLFFTIKKRSMILKHYMK